jgi:glucokinase
VYEASRAGVVYGNRFSYAGTVTAITATVFIWTANAGGGYISTGARDWLLIDCSHKGEVILAHAKPSVSPQIGKLHRYETTIPTFTDVLLRFSRDSGHQLADLQPAIAIAGVAGGPSMIIERSRWVISYDGLTSLFARAPIIINEVAAQAWALRASLQGVTLVHGASLPDISKKARYAFLTYNEGVGTAILDIDEHGRYSVLDGEGGQLDFASISDDERDLARLIPTVAGTAISWETILMLRKDIATKAIDNPDLLFARLLGRFVSNLMYANGAWSGAFMTGPLIPSPNVDAEFSSALTMRRPYPRLLTKSAVCRVVQSDAVLRGCAVTLASRFGLL